MSENVAGEEPYLLVEEVAERLGLPLSVLLHRVEAGDIPSRRIEAEDGVHYALRLEDLGIELDDLGIRASAIEAAESTMSATFEAPTTAPVDGGIVFEPIESAGAESAIVSAFNSESHQLPGGRTDTLEVTGAPVDERDSASEVSEDGDWAAFDAASPWAEPEAEHAATPAGSARPREPQQPPPWIIRGPESTDDTVIEEDESAIRTESPDEAELSLDVDNSPAHARDAPEEDDERYLPPSSAAGTADDEDDGIPALFYAGDSDEKDEFDEDTVTAELAVPPPSRQQGGLLDTGLQSPRGDLASMSLDARELVAGLLDRWERTLEQRIYTEQRQRFQAELVARQNMVKQLQMELHTARAEHAAAQAEKDRALAAKERELADRERDLADSRRKAEEAQHESAHASRRRRWFRGRDD